MNSNRRNVLERLLDRSIAQLGKERYVGAKIAVFLLIFFSITLIHSYFSVDSMHGVLSMVQALASVLVVFTAGQKGFRAVIFAGAVQIVFVSFYYFQTRDFSSLPGILIPLGMILILFVVVLYNRRILDHIELYAKQTESLQGLNEELEAKEREAIKHSATLAEYNRTMKEKEQKLYHLVHYDSLTELPNRRKIKDRIELLISLLAPKKLGFSLLYIDIDHFKRINDSLGHHIGDEVLKSISRRMKEAIHSDDMVGRMGGDDFAVIIQRQLNESELLTYAEGLRTIIAQKIEIEGADLGLSASIGIAIYPDDGDSVEGIMKSAETAMYKTKEYGRNSIHFFKKEMNEDIMVRVKYESGLMSSIEKNELFIVFQPQYHTASKKFRGFEALARWKNEKFGTVSPGHFIPLAEQMGFILPLGEYVLEQACIKLCKMMKEYGTDIIMSVNISAVQIMSPFFVRSVKRIIHKTNCNPLNLEFEVTESVMIAATERERVIAVLNELRNLGIRIALDDFGTGYSSLSYLQVLPIQTLKIDKAFVDNMIQERVQRLMVGSIISLVHQMDMEVVAEGVDHPSQLDFLRDFGCDYIQGYIWGYPLPEADALRLLESIRND